MFHQNLLHLQLFATAWNLVREPGSCQLPMVLGRAVLAGKKAVDILEIIATRID